MPVYNKGGCMFDKKKFIKRWLIGSASYIAVLAFVPHIAVQVALAGFVIASVDYILRTR